VTLQNPRAKINQLQIPSKKDIPSNHFKPNAKNSEKIYKKETPQRKHNSEE
jgi:hypothetical protein